jgi:hypothetical protein
MRLKAPPDWRLTWLLVGVAYEKTCHGDALEKLTLRSGISAVRMTPSKGDPGDDRPEGSGEVAESYRRPPISHVGVQGVLRALRAA